MRAPLSGVAPFPFGAVIWWRFSTKWRALRRWIITDSVTGMTTNRSDEGMATIHELVIDEVRKLQMPEGWTFEEAENLLKTIFGEEEK